MIWVPGGNVAWFSSIKVVFVVPAPGSVLETGTVSGSFRGIVMVSGAESEPGPSGGTAVGEAPAKTRKARVTWEDGPGITRAAGADVARAVAKGLATVWAAFAGTRTITPWPKLRRTPDKVAREVSTGIRDRSLATAGSEAMADGLTASEGLADLWHNSGAASPGTGVPAVQVGVIEVSDTTRGLVDTEFCARA